MPGYTSQLPSTPTTPHGPLRSCLGQVIGQAYAVTGSAHWPHMRQPKMRFLTWRSRKVKAWYSGLVFIRNTDTPYHSGRRRSSTRCIAFMDGALVRGGNG